MRRSTQLASGLRILTARLAGKRVPVAVRWNLLHRCAFRCEYCNLWKTPIEELATDTIISGLEQLARLGATRISFSGGEPLLRDDIGTLVSAAARLGISPSLNSSGFMLDKRIDELGDLDLLKISLDGPRDIHNASRGQPFAFDTAIAAADLAHRRLRKFTFAATITRRNVQHIEDLMDIARSYGTVIAFQPVKALYHGVETVDRIAPDPAAMRRVIAKLIDEKRRGNPHIRNSMAELNHIRNWPNYPALTCGAGRIFVMLNPDGTVMPCDRVSYTGELPTFPEVGLAEAISKLPEVHCSGCGFCGSLSLNLLYSLNPRPILDILRLVN